jgi:hypothetical protein
MRRVTTLVFVLVVVLGVSTAAWYWACLRLEEGFADWQAAQQAQGWTVTHGPTSHAGWPLHARLVVPGLSVSGGNRDIPGGVSWQASRLALDVSVLHPRTLSLLPEGPQTVRVANSPAIAWHADQFEVTMPLDPDAPPQSADLVCRGLHVGAPGMPGEAVVGLLTGHVGMPADGASITVAVSSEAITLPQGRSWPLGPSIGSVALQATLSGLGAGQPGPSGWRDAGGRLDIRQMSIGWGPLGLTGQGRLALDGQLQPAGTASLRLVGAGPALDVLVANHAVAPRTALAVNAVLGRMTTIPADGGAPQVELPLALRDRTVTLGQIPLARMPELVWSAPR